MDRASFPRVYPIVDTASLERVAIEPIAASAAMLDAGARILQFRHKGFWSRDIFAQAEHIAKLCAQAQAAFIVNDRADYALLLNAGLHLGQDDLLPSDARAVIGVAATIGFSAHNPEQMLAAASEPVDYVAFGPVFPTLSKERPDPTVGLELLRTARTLTERPLVAIGGLTQKNAVECWKAGADSVAIISALLPNPCTPSAIRSRMTEWLGMAGGFAI